MLNLLLNGCTAINLWLECKNVENLIVIYISIKKMKEKNTHNTAETFEESKLFCAYLLKVGKSSISPVKEKRNTKNSSHLAL